MNDTDYWNKAVREYREKTNDQRRLEELTPEELSSIVQRAQKLKEDDQHKSPKKDG